MRTGFWGGGTAAATPLLAPWWPPLSPEAFSTPASQTGRWHIGHWLRSLERNTILTKLKKKSTYLAVFGQPGNDALVVVHWKSICHRLIVCSIKNNKKTNHWRASCLRLANVLCSHGNTVSFSPFTNSSKQTTHVSGCWPVNNTDVS